MLHNLIEKLDEKKLTEDFLFAIRGMSSGYIPIDTIPHLAFLDSVRFKRFKMSCNMTYSQKMKNFGTVSTKLAVGLHCDFCLRLKGQEITIWIPNLAP